MANKEIENSRFRSILGMNQQAQQAANAPAPAVPEAHAVAGTDWEAGSDKAPPIVDAAFADAARKLKQV